MIYVHNSVLDTCAYDMQQWVKLTYCLINFAHSSTIVTVTFTEQHVRLKTVVIPLSAQIYMCTNVMQANCIDADFQLRGFHNKVG